VEPTKRRNLAVSILALGVVALVVDRIVLQPGGTGPSRVSAGVVTEAIGPSSQSTSPAGISRESLATRLRQAAYASDRASADSNMFGPALPEDVFAGPVAWRGSVTLPVREEARREAPKEAPAMPTLRLTSVFNGTHAVINGETLRVGQSVDVVSENKVRYTVVLDSINAADRRAVVRVNGREVTLEVPRPGVSPR